MIKKVLLAGSVLSLAAAVNAGEKEFYVIKDGKMVNCEFVKGDVADDMQTIIKESKNDAGDDMVEIVNPAEKYTAGWVYLPEAIDLNQAWILDVEYYFNKDINFSGENIKREGLSFDLMADTIPVDGATWATSRAQEEYRISHVSIDCTWRDFIDLVDGDTVTNNYGVGKLRNVRKYVYSSLLLPKGVAKRGDANKVKAIFMSIFPEGGVEASCFIKNLKFVSEGTKPFYADKLAPLAGEGTIYIGSVSNYIYGTYASNDLEKQETSKKFPAFDPNKMVGQQLFLAKSSDPYYSYMGSDRMYCETGEQREAGFFDTEYGFLPYLKAATEDNERVDESGNLSDAVIRIPLGEGAVDKTISVAMRLGHNAGTSGDLTPYADYIAGSKDIAFPVEYRFESGNAAKVSSATDWTAFRPTYTKGGDDFVDSIPTMMSMVYGDVELPSKDYNYISLRFRTNDVISYMFTDLRLTGDKNAWPVKTNDVVLGKDFAGFMIPENPKSGVENVIAKGEVSIYPNPATDVITVSNEGVKSVAIYTVAGALVASSESNSVNVASLANGIYVVKANTEAGVITGQIIKK